MPIYEYQCTSSGERFEVQQKISDPPIKTCDQLSCSCGTPQPVTKMISAPAIMFKGTGWYVTDYSDKMKEPGSKSENKGQPVEPKNAESKTDSKTGSTGSESGKSSAAPAPATTSTGSSGSSPSSGSSSSSGSSASSGSSSSSLTSSSS
ncbi:MAG: zinc ribbon domain-containing protein [Nitrospirota bacterium]|nr:zinc ribbon domain-containing protein [Nitrospirota bacterium]